MYDKPKYDEPLTMPDLETQPFWDGAKAGKLLLPKCLDYGQYHFSPAPFVPIAGWKTGPGLPPRATA